MKVCTIKCESCGASLDIIGRSQVAVNQGVYFDQELNILFDSNKMALMAWGDSLIIKCDHCGTENVLQEFQHREATESHLQSQVNVHLEGDGAVAVGKGAVAVGKGGVVIQNNASSGGIRANTIKANTIVSGVYITGEVIADGDFICGDSASTTVIIHNETD